MIEMIVFHAKPGWKVPWDILIDLAIHAIDWVFKLISACPAPVIVM